MLPLADINAKPDPTHTIAYLAGFVDGEGCIRITCNRGNIKRNASPHYRLTILVSQCADHKEPLEMLKDTFGGWLGNNSSKAGCKQMMQWRADGDVAAEALRHLLPYLKVKRLAAQAGLSFHYYKEVMRLGRKAGERLPEDEIYMGVMFTQLFYVLNGNKPLNGRKIPRISPLAELEGNVTDCRAGTRLNRVGLAQEEKQ